MSAEIQKPRSRRRSPGQRPRRDPGEVAFFGVSVRVDSEIASRLDRLAVLISEPGEVIASRAYTARRCLLAGLDALERELARGER